MLLESVAWAARTRQLLGHSVIRYGVASAFPRAVAAFTALVMAPLGVEQLGTSGYGVWVLATQVPSLVVSPDLGLGQGVTTELVLTFSRTGSSDSAQSRLYAIRRILQFVAAGWLVIGVLAAFVYTRSDSSSPNSGIVFLCLSVAVVCFVAGVPSTIWRRAQLAQERGATGMVWEGLGKSCSLAACVGLLYFWPNPAAWSPLSCYRRLSLCG